MIDLSVIVVISMLFWFVLFLISVHKPTDSSQTAYKVPFVPLLPTLSMFFNIGLMVNLEALTWFRLILWMIIGIMCLLTVELLTEHCSPGLVIYFGYGIHKSKANHSCKQLQAINAEDIRKWGSLDDTSCLTDNISMSSTY